MIILQLNYLFFCPLYFLSIPLSLSSSLSLLPYFSSLSISLFFLIFSHPISNLCLFLSFYNSLSLPLPLLSLALYHLCLFLSLSISNSLFPSFSHNVNPKHCFSELFVFFILTFKEFF